MDTNEQTNQQTNITIGGSRINTDITPGLLGLTGSNQAAARSFGGLDGSGSPFRRSGVLRRTPPQSPVRGYQGLGDITPNAQIPKDNAAVQPPQAKEKTNKERGGVAPHNIDQMDGQINEDITTPLTSAEISRPGTLSIEDMREREDIDIELDKFKAILSRMKAATNRQRNISIDIKNGLVELEEVASAIKYHRRKWKAVEHQSKAPMEQTNVRTPVPVGDKLALGSSKRIASSPAEEKEGKKSRGEDQTVPTAGWERQNTKGQRRRRKLEAERLRPDNAETPPARRVVASTSPRKRASKMFRPEALLIRPAEGQSYAEVLREIRSGAKPDESEAEVTAIRQTRAQDILLELGPQTKNKEGFCEALKNILGEKGNIHYLGSKVQLEIRDLDSYTDKAEVEAAIKRDIPDAGDLNISVFPTYREQKVAIIGMSGKPASKLREK